MKPNFEKVLKLKRIEEEIKRCEKCSLSKTRKLPVPGNGNVDAKVMLIGLGPGYHENLQGKPFVGKSGKFLDELLELGGVRREEVYITNVIKCYLPNNSPTQDQINLCSNYLDKQIELIKPRVILTLGNIATSYIFRKFNFKLEPMGKIHGKILQLSTLLLQAKIIPMYHPASALYDPGLKESLRTDWESLKGVI